MPTIYSGPPTVTSENNTESDSEDLEAEGMFIISANDQKILPTYKIGCHKYLLDARNSKIWIKFKSNQPFLRAEPDTAEKSS